MAFDLERELDELYGADLSEFTRARNELAKRLRTDGEAEAADRVAALRKPPVPVWAANQLARDARKEVDRLLDAGHRVRDAHRKALEKGDPEALDAARSAQTAAVQTLLRRASDILGERHGSASEATLDRLGATLRAASVDDDGRELLALGRLEEEVEPAGFEALAPLADALKASPGVRKARDAKDKRGRVAELREQVREAKARETELRAAARDAQRAADRARKDADRLQAEADRAAARAEAAAQAVEEAEEQLGKER